jgi:hypothetical protein
MIASLVIACCLALGQITTPGSNVGTNSDGFGTATGYAPPEDVYPLPRYSTEPEEGGVWIGFGLIRWLRDKREDSAAAKWLATMLSPRQDFEFDSMGLCHRAHETRERRQLAFSLFAVRDSDTALLDWLVTETSADGIQPTPWDQWSFPTTKNPLRSASFWDLVDQDGGLPHWESLRSSVLAGAVGS